MVAHKLPPPGTGGETEYADSRTAYDDLPEETKKKLEGVVGNHSLFHSRKTAVPEYFKDLDPTKYPMSKHKMVQMHEWSGRPVSDEKKKQVGTQNVDRHIDTILRRLRPSFR